MLCDLPLFDEIRVHEILIALRKKREKRQRIETVNGERDVQQTEIRLYTVKKTDDDPVDELDSFCVCQFLLVILPNAVIYMLP